jgi:hypothetical protein
VPCAHDTITRLRFGAGPSGAITMLDSAAAEPDSDCVCDSTRHARAPGGAAMGTARMRSPGSPSGSGTGGR